METGKTDTFGAYRTWTWFPHSSGGARVERREWGQVEDYLCSPPSRWKVFAHREFSAEELAAAPAWVQEHLAFLRQ